MASSISRGTREVDLCVVGLGPAGRALAHRASQAGLTVAVVDPRPDRLWPPTFGCWVDELPSWLPATTIAVRIARPIVWTNRRRNIDREYCVLSKPRLRAALSLDDARVVAARATRVEPHRVKLSNGTALTAATVFDTRGSTSGHRRRMASAHGIFVDADIAAPMIGDGEGLLMDWRRGNGASSQEPPSFLYAMPLGDGTVVFEETSLGLCGGMPQHELRRRTVNRLAAHGIRLNGDERCEAAHYPLVEPPPKPGAGRVVGYGARGGMMNPATGYSVADSLALADTAVTALQQGEDPIAALWPWQARLVYWMRVRGLWGLGRLTTEQSIAAFDSFFTATPRGQRAVLSTRDDYATLAALLVRTVAHTWPFHWRFDFVGWTHRNRWTDYTFNLPARTQQSHPGASATP
ncbi:lycopene cyclase family protein [Nocardia aobensis]|uniref:lycopene cyclase family protein n=1 Tax=Nocardia aobensis TaxID=257277 RepID=UPI0007C72F80|nr:lycopene cyclase family protein [Nocardia aobensis]